jgi:hypothetical protein
MPNWCENKLTIHDCSPELKSFLEDGFSFEKIKPTPPELTEDEPFYNWCCRNWGTKWDLSEQEQREVAAQLLSEFSAYFDTAWSPPIEAIVELSKMFPKDKFRLDYYEGGNVFGGYAEIFDGICEDEEFDASDLKETLDKAEETGEFVDLKFLLTNA